MTKKSQDEKPLEEGLYQEQMEPETDAQRMLKLERIVQDLLNEKVDLQNRLSRVEYAGTNKNKRREFDVMQDNSEDIKYGHIPSKDGKIPIINWNPIKGGMSYLDEANGMLVDTQAVLVEYKDGTTAKYSLMELNPIHLGNSIKARCNDWMKFKAKIDKIYKDRYKLQTMQVRGSQPKKNISEAWNKLAEEEKNITMNVTLSEDGGNSYEGDTFDILAKMWNGLA